MSVIVADFVLIKDSRDSIGAINAQPSRYCRGGLIDR
jgi:hypothetical protein